jgi:hypothetical protein
VKKQGKGEQREGKERIKVVRFTYTEESKSSRRDENPGMLVQYLETRCRRSMETHERKMKRS